jgi:hypothetical protein
MEYFFSFVVAADGPNHGRNFLTDQTTETLLPLLLGIDNWSSMPKWTHVDSKNIAT